jgi:spore maturation protein SpmA
LKAPETSLKEMENVNEQNGGKVQFFRLFLVLHTVPVPVVPTFIYSRRRVVSTVFIYIFEFPCHGR